MELKSSLITCACHSPEHSLQFDYDPDENDLFIYIHLNQLSFFKRLWYGIKYISGYQPRYGHYEECFFDNKNSGEMIDLFTKIWTKMMKEKR